MQPQAPPQPRTAPPADPLARVAERASEMLLAGSTSGSSSADALRSELPALDALGAANPRAGALAALAAAAHRALDPSSGGPAALLGLAHAAHAIERARAQPASPGGELAPLARVAVHTLPHVHLPAYERPAFSQAESDVPAWVVCDDTEAVVALSDMLHARKHSHAGVVQLQAWAQTTVAHDARLVPVWVSALLDDHSASSAAGIALRYAAPARLLACLRAVYDPRAPGMGAVFYRLTSLAGPDEVARLTREALDEGDASLAPFALNVAADNAPEVLLEYARAQLAQCRLPSATAQTESKLSAVLQQLAQQKTAEAADLVFEVFATGPSLRLWYPVLYALRALGAHVMRPRARAALDALLANRAAGTLSADEERRVSLLVELICEGPPVEDDHARMVRAFEVLAVPEHRVGVAKQLFDRLNDASLRAFADSVSGASQQLFPYAAQALSRARPSLAYDHLAPIVFDANALRTPDSRAVQALAALAEAAAPPFSITPDPRWFEPLSRRIQSGLVGPLKKHAETVVAACAAHIPLEQLGGEAGGADGDGGRAALLRVACVPGAARWPALVTLARKGGASTAACIVDLFEFRGTALREKIAKGMLEGAVEKAADALRCAAVDRDRDLPFDEAKLERLRSAVPA